MPGVVVAETLVILVLLVILVRMVQGNKVMGAELQRLGDEVRENESVVDSAVTALSGLANRLRVALMDGNPAAEISALADELDANSQRLALAIAANTVSENDSTEFDAEELDEAEEPVADEGESDSSEEPVVSGEPVESDEPSATEDTSSPTDVSDDTVSAVDVAIDSGAAGTEPAVTDEGEGEADSNA